MSAEPGVHTARFVLNFSEIHTVGENNASNCVKFSATGSRKILIDTDFCLHFIISVS